MPPDLLRRWPLLVALALLGVLIPLTLGSRASRPPPVYFLHDQRHYLAMAEHSGAVVPAPFAWRVLPSAIVRASGLRAERGFHALTLLTLALIPPAMAMLLAAAGASPRSALLLGALAAASPAVAGYLSWDFIRPDGLSLLLITVSAWAVVRGHRALFITVMVALSLTKETWVIAAAFALIWSRAYAPAFWRWAIAGAALAVIVAATVRIMMPAHEPYSLLANARDLYWPLDARTIARRLLLATAATWNVLLPLAAFAVTRRIREPRAWAAAVAVSIASAQVLVAIDTQRLVAAALPFVLLACAWELDALAPAFRVPAIVALAAAQLPWLLVYARIWSPPLRALEIVIALAAAAAAVIGLRQRSLTM
jgi:hypothetical protein